MPSLPPSSVARARWSAFACASAASGDTIVRKNDQVLQLSALHPGDVVYLVVVRCPSGSVRALRILFVPPATVTPPPPPPTDACTKSEGNVVLVALGTSAIKVSTSSTESGATAVTVTGDTIVRKNDQNVALSALTPGDLVHVVIVRCTSGSVRALSITFLRSAA